MLVSSILVKAVFLSWIKPSVALNFRSPTSKQFCRKMSASFAIAGLPRPPSSILTDFGRSLRKSIIPDMEELQAEQTSADDTRDSIFRQTKTVLKTNAEILFAVRTGQVESLDALISDNSLRISQILELISGDPQQREGRLSQAIEKFTEARLMQSFFVTGKLAPTANVQPCNDDEYIGASLGFAQEISRYVIGRASEGDRASIALCRRLITQLNAKMLEFDFRNGPLRKKYDGLKYALKTIEDVTYELSLLDDDVSGVEDNQDPSANKKRRIEGSDGASDSSVNGGNSAAATAAVSSGAGGVEVDVEESLLDDAALDAIRGRMEVYDKLREDVIKQSRDVQKLAKQAVFSVHRGQLADSRNKLNSAEKIARHILTMIAEGSFSNSLEEWAEGILTLEWAENKKILSMAELKIVNSTEYIGALSDFTGEIGRMAVASASRRDTDSVRDVLQADVTIAGALMQANTSGKYTRKTDAVLQNLKKVEDIVYELSMLKKGGRVKEREAEPRDCKDNGAEAADEN